jgi:hypothetical protein
LSQTIGGPAAAVGDPFAVRSAFPPPLKSSEDPATVFATMGRHAWRFAVRTGTY